jgi:hypothetical protein
MYEISSTFGHKNLDKRVATAAKKSSSDRRNTIIIFISQMNNTITKGIS